MFFATVLLAMAPVSIDPAPGHHGLFLRLDLGAGYYRSSSGDVAISGGSGALGFSIGGNVADNVALFVSLFDFAPGMPTVSAGGSSATPRDFTAGAGGAGIGLNYYFMPMNVFLSATAGVGGMTYHGGFFSSHIGAGLAGRVGAGKEWMISESWGLGLAGYLNFAFTPDEYSGQPGWQTWSPVVAFSATFY